MRGVTVAFAFALGVAAIALACGSFDSVSDTTDAGSNAGSDAASDGAHTFFDNFDDGPLGAKWFDKGINAPATIELATDQVVSSPNALFVKYPDDAGEFTFGAYLSHRFDKPTKKLTCRVKVWVEDHSHQATPSILNVKFRVPVGNAAIDFSLNDDRSAINIFQVEGGGPKTGEPLTRSRRNAGSISRSRSTSTRATSI